MWRGALPTLRRAGALACASAAALSLDGFVLQQPSEEVMDVSDPSEARVRDVVLTSGELSGVPLRDARRGSYDLHADGFTVVSGAPPVGKPGTERQVMIEDYYGGIGQLVEQCFPVHSRAVVFVHAFRSTLRCPACCVHNDYAFPSQGYRQARNQLVAEPEHEEALRSHNFSIVNCWMPIETVRRDPLAVCRWREGRSPADMMECVVKRDLDDWYYVPDMQPGEALVFKQYDSAAELVAETPSSSKLRYKRERSAFTLHAAVKLPDQEPAPADESADNPPPAPRVSVEFRVLVLEDPDGKLPSSFGRASIERLVAAASAMKT